MPSTRDPVALVDALHAGDRRALARALSVVERGGPLAAEVGRMAWNLGGRSYAIGLTGAPGAGKSTLTSAVVSLARAAGDEIAVLAVDPSSPFTGGAILGDRIRMQDHALDQGVFIRSMASRGHLGGLALASPQAYRVLDAAGFPWVVLETVGVGQVEVEVAGAADTTVVVVNPGWGDSIQANKAGLFEIADIFVINKADRPGADMARTDLRAMLELSDELADRGSDDWHPPILTTVALGADGGPPTGIDDLWASIATHRSWQEDHGELERRRERRLATEIRAIVAQTLAVRARGLTDTTAFEQLLDDVQARRLDPYTAAERILGDG